jgi:hypothetical protein
MSKSPVLDRVRSKQNAPDLGDKDPLIQTVSAAQTFAIKHNTTFSDALRRITSAASVLIQAQDSRQNPNLKQPTLREAKLPSL